MSKIKVLMVDNYDSFTFNIVQYFGELGADIEVFRNDEITIEDIAQRNPDRLVISPGPCSPAEAGISVAAIQHFAGKLPISYCIKYRLCQRSASGCQNDDALHELALYRKSFIHDESCCSRTDSDFKCNR